MSRFSITWRPFALLAALALAGCASKPADPGTLPVYRTADLTPEWSVSGVEHTIADFALTDQTGARFTRADLAGKVYVAGFFFVRCTAVCPTLRSNLRLVQDAFIADDRVALVSHTVDPRSDSASVLQAYGQANGVIETKWHLLTGPQDEITALARDSYFADPDGLASGYVHTENVYLVDSDGHIRGVYNGTLETDIMHLIDDIRLLLGEVS